MEEELERDLLVKDILNLSARVYTLSGEIPKVLHDDVLTKLTLQDLIDLKRKLRDMARSLGGIRD